MLHLPRVFPADDGDGAERKNCEPRNLLRSAQVELLDSLEEAEYW